MPQVTGRPGVRRRPFGFIQLSSNNRSSVPLESDTPREAFQRVFEKLTRMSQDLLEIEDWFDARSHDLRVPFLRPPVLGDAFTGLESVDEVIRREAATE